MNTMRSRIAGTCAGRSWSSIYDRVGLVVPTILFPRVSDVVRLYKTTMRGYDASRMVIDPDCAALFMNMWPNNGGD